MRRVLNTNVFRRFLTVLGVVIVSGGASACGSDSSPSGEGAAERPDVVVTTNILGDVVGAAIGDVADVEVIMPLGSDPHDFAPSARQAESMENADLLVVNGAGFEEGMLDIIANVTDSGTEVVAFADQIDLLESSHHEDEHAADEDARDQEEVPEEEVHEEEGHEGKGDDPHLWTDPTRIATAVEALEPVVARIDGVDAAALSSSIDAYLAELDSLEASMETTLAAVPDDRRVLVTNHEVFAYFADRFGFEVVGAIVPSLTTNAEPSAADIEELAALMRDKRVPAVFGETTQSSQLADALADEIGGDVEVVELFSESLGEAGSGAESYIEMMQLNADLIAEALSV
jgi:zinc/manganese transport system substrate-binding protein